MNTRLQAAIEEWQSVLGAEHVIVDAAALQQITRNTSGLERRVPSVLRPGTTEEVRAVVLTANRHRVPVHPISRGKNWGLGSKLPVQDDVVLVDLSRMHRIHEVSVEGHYAVVEPAVTQGQLYDHLKAHNLPLVLNVTGSGRETSLIGNALERGIGYFESRAASLSGLEVVLGSGDIVRTGMAHFETARIAHLYKYGVGPHLDGLFAQSNFGIVTKAGVDLMPQPDAHVSIISRIESEDRLPAFVDALADLKRRDIIRTVVHIGNRHRTEITLAPLVADALAKKAECGRSAQRERAARIVRKAGFGPWSAVAGVFGTKGQLKDAEKQIRCKLAGIADVRAITDDTLQRTERVLRGLRWLPACEDKLALCHAIKPLYGLSKGIPTDEPLKSVYWPIGEEAPHDSPDPDESHCGLLYCVPFIPMNGAAAQAVVNQTNRVFDAHGFAPYITLNMVDTRAFEGVISLAFDRRDPHQVDAAQTCVERLQADFIRDGYLPYRVGIQYMSQIVDVQDPFWVTVSKLKRVLDPNGIISPGRYCPA